MDSNTWERFISLLNQDKKDPVVAPILKKTSFVKYENGLLDLACPNSGMKFFLLTKKLEIETRLLELTGNSVNISFSVGEKIKNRRGRKKEAPLLKYEESLEAIHIAGLQKQFTFDKFAVSSTNQLAYTAAETISENLGKFYNPFFIYGGVGVGKTHLLQSIGNRVLEKDPSKKILYCSSEDFTNDLIGSIRNRNTQLFRKKYRNLNILLLDDIQFIAGKNSAQEEFFHTFNTIIRYGGQVVLTSDQPPKNIKNLEERLRSRFSGGLSIDIQKPEFELRTAIVLIKAKERNIEIDIEAAKLIAQEIEDTRELEGKLLGIYTHMTGNNKELTRDLVRKELYKVRDDIKTKLNPQDVIKIVCSYYNIRPLQIKSPGRSEQVAFARQIIMFILRNILKLKLDEIAYILKRKDHTTIMHGVNKITKLELKNPQLKEEIGRIINALSLST